MMVEHEYNGSTELNDEGGGDLTELCDRDDVNTGDNTGGENNSLPTPSMRDDAQRPYSNRDGAKKMVYSDEKCEISKDKICTTHVCGTRTIKVSSIKWVMNKNTGLHHNKSTKVTKLICVAKNGGVEDCKAATPTRSRAIRDNLVSRAVGRLKNTEISSNPRSFECESSE